MTYLHRFLLLAAALTAAILIAPVTNGAAMAATPAPYLSAAVNADNSSVTALLRNGAFRPDLANNELQVTDRDGRILDRFPLIGLLNGVPVPVRYTLTADRTRATLVPQWSLQVRNAINESAIRAAEVKPAHPAPRPARITKQQRYTMMWTELNKGWKDFTPISTLLGGLIGFLLFPPLFIGAIVGAFVGAFIGYQTSNPKAWPAVVAWWNTP